MKFPVLFTVGGLSLLLLASQSGGPAWALVWPAIDLFILAWIYGADRPDVLGKRKDGSQSAAVIALMLPYFALTWFAWHLWRRVTPEPGANEVADRIWVGRRPFPAELPPHTALIVDLTAEFKVAAGVADRAPVVLLPTLDARAPDADRMREVVDRILTIDAGPIYIHCAAGHGRSATLAAAVLVLRGDAPDVQAAESAMKAQRPGIHLHRVQRRAAEAAVSLPR